jgi:hypothetical protein
MNKTLIILILLLNSCLSEKQITNTGVEEIHFGTGGGFTGVETTYKLNRKGNIIDENNKIIYNMNKRDLTFVFEQAEKNKNTKINKPENLYSFLVIVSKTQRNRIVWGYETYDVPKKIKELHEYLMKKTFKN